MQRRRLATVSAVLVAFILVATVGVIQVVSANAAKIDVATISVNPGATGFLIPVTITSQATPGMAAFDVTVAYDNSVINVTAAQDGPTGFTLAPNLTAGSARVVGFTGSVAVNGTFVLFNLVANAVGNGGASTALTLTITDYGDSNADPIAIGTTQNGSVTINTLPTFSLSPTSTSIGEGAGNVTLTVSLSPTSTSQQTVTVNTVEGTATAGSDFTALSGTTVTIPANAASATVQVGILQDTLDEAGETFQVVLSSPSSGTLLSTTAGTSTVTITDDDANPTVAVNTSTVTTTEGSGSFNITFQANLSTASGQPVTVAFATQNGTATGGSDYTIKSGTLTFAAGTTVTTTSIQILGDSTYEGDETFLIVLTNGATTKAVETISITAATTTVTLQNDDTPTAANDSYSATEDTTLTVNAGSGVLANDPNFFTRSASVVTNGSLGNAIMATDGSFVYTPNLNANGSDSFIYRYNDGRFDSATAIVTISITAVNDAPIAVDDFYAVEPGVTLSVNAAAGLLANDTDVDTSDSKIFVSNTALSPVISGTALSTIATDGSFTYNPGTTNDTQTFTYVMRDTAGETSTATVTLSQGPTFKMEILSSLPIDEDATGASVNVKITLINPTSTSASTVVFSSVVGTTSPSQVAADSSDFTVASQAVTLSITSTTTTIQVSITNDSPAIREGLEYFVIQLSSPGSSNNTHTPVISGSVSGVAKLPVSIDDTQDIPKLSIADVTLVEGTGVVKSGHAGVSGKVTVTLTGRTKFSTQFNYTVISTSTSPAAGSSDFVTVSSGGPITIGPNTSTGSTTTTITVTILNDTIDEFDEIFEVRLLSPTEKSGAKASVGFTDNVAVVTIEDDDNAPTIEILKPAHQLESATPATISVKLNGASSAGVKVSYASSDGTATAGSDYTASSGTLTWAADESGIKTFTVTITDDAVEEDGETVTLTLSGATTTTASPSTPGVSIATTTATLLILDDEPVAAIVTIMSDGEAMPGDGYFLIVAGSNSPALSLSGLSGAQITSPMNQTLMPISNVSEVIRKMLGLDTLRSKTVTHAWYAVASTSTGQQAIKFDVTLTYSSKTHNVSATLNKVTARTNRNFWIQDGVNFVGLGLIPDDKSITNMLKQPVWNANPALGGALSRQVTLADVIQPIFAFSFSNNAFFSSYNTADPITGANAADTLTELKPFQGMVFMSRNSVTPNNASSTSVFDWVNVPGVGTTSVPIKINLQGPYLATSGNNPPLPVSQQLRTGFNLIAPHIWAPTSFDKTFIGSSAGLDLATIFGTATSFQKGVFPVGVSPSVIGALVVPGAFLTQSGSGTIDPVLSYWLKVSLPSGATQPTVSVSGPNSGEKP